MPIDAVASARPTAFVFAAFNPSELTSGWGAIIEFTNDGESQSIQFSGRLSASSPYEAGIDAVLNALNVASQNYPGRNLMLVCPTGIADAVNHLLPTWKASAFMRIDYRSGEEREMPFADNWKRLDCELSSSDVEIRFEPESQINGKAHRWGPQMALASMLARDQAGLSGFAKKYQPPRWMR